MNTAALSTTGAGTINNAGTANAGVPIPNGGTFNNQNGGLVTGGLDNTGTFTTATGAADGGLTNEASGTVTASGGTSTARSTTSRRNFTVSGPVTGNGTFFNESAATLTVNTAGSYALTAAPDQRRNDQHGGNPQSRRTPNSGTVTASAGAVNGPIDNQNNGVFVP